MPYRVLHYVGALSDQSLGLVIAELSGTVRWSDVADALRRLYLDPAFMPGSAVLWDAWGVTSVDVAPGDLHDVRETFAEVADVREGGRTAYLVGPYGGERLWSLFQTLYRPSSRRVAFFRRRAEALAFVGGVSLPSQGGEEEVALAW